MFIKPGIGQGKQGLNSGQMLALAQELRIERETLYEAALGFCWWPDGIVETGNAHSPGRLVQGSKRFNQSPGSVGSQRSIA